MVAIDEVHLVKQWRISKFREEYSKLGELRSRLGHNVAWFGCTATFDAETRKKAISSVRFNKAVDIIRTSVDRPDIRLIITPMQRKSVKSFAGLFFTIRNAIDEEKNPTPAAIPKTMIFVDSRRGISAAVNQVQAWLLAMSPQYTPDQ